MRLRRQDGGSEKARESRREYGRGDPYIHAPDSEKARILPLNSLMSQQRATYQFGKDVDGLEPSTQFWNDNIRRTSEWILSYNQ